MLVVDASLVVQACLSKAGFTPLENEELVAPPLLWSEVTASLHQSMWRGVVTRDLAATALARLHDAPISPRRPAKLFAEAWQVAEELGWAKTYDAEYVALAKLLDCRLVTVDGRLIRGASRIIDVTGPTRI